MKGFILFIQSDICSFCDNLLQHLYLVDKKHQHSNNIRARVQKISYLVKQIKGALFSLFNELKFLQQEIAYFENQQGDKNVKRVK